MDIIDTLDKLKSNTRMICCGPSQSGKSTFVTKLIKENVYDPMPKRVLWCYGAVQPLFHELDGRVEFIEGLPTDLYDRFSPENPTLLIIDDLLNEIVDSKLASKIFCVGSHHLQVTVILLTQVLFPKGKVFRTLSLNASYFCLYKSPRDAQQGTILGTQMGIAKLFTESFRDATKEPFSYLFVDVTPSCPEAFRLRSRILPSEAPQIIYQAK